MLSAGERNLENKTKKEILLAHRTLFKSTLKISRFEMHFPGLFARISNSAHFLKLASLLLYCMCRAITTHLYILYLLYITALSIQYIYTVHHKEHYCYRLLLSQQCMLLCYSPYWATCSHGQVEPAHAVCHEKTQTEWCEIWSKKVSFKREINILCIKY